MEIEIIPINRILRGHNIRYSHCAEISETIGDRFCARFETASNNTSPVLVNGNFEHLGKLGQDFIYWIDSEYYKNRVLAVNLNVQEHRFYDILKELRIDKLGGQKIIFLTRSPRQLEYELVRYTERAYGNS